MPLLDIAIVLYKPGDIEARLLREISAMTPTPHTLSIFDNSSNDKNYSMALNDLAAKGSSPYIALLHSDILVSHGWEKPLIEALEAHPEYGAALPNPARFDQIGKTFALSDPPTAQEIEAWASYSRENMKGAHLAWTSEGCDCAVFFCVVMRRAIFESLKGFDERFRFVGNNHEFQWRLKARGLLTVMIHASSVWHKDALSFRKAIGSGNFNENNEGRHWEFWKREIQSGRAKKWHELSDPERLAIRKDPKNQIGAELKLWPRGGA